MVIKLHLLLTAFQLLVAAAYRKQMGKRRVTLLVIRYWTQLGHQLVELMAMLQYAWPESQTQYPVKSIWDSSGCSHGAVLEIISLSADGMVLHGVRTFVAVSVHTEQLICNPDKLSKLTCACVYPWGSRHACLHEHLCTIGKILSTIHTSVFWIFTRSNFSDIVMDDTHSDCKICYVYSPDLGSREESCLLKFLDVVFYNTRKDS